MSSILDRSMASTKPMNIYMGVGVTAFRITCHVKKKQKKLGKANVLIQTKCFQIFFLTKYKFFYIKILKVKSCCLTFFHFSFLCSYLPIFSFTSTVKQLSGDLHLFWEYFLFRFLRRAFYSAWKKSKSK